MFTKCESMKCVQLDGNIHNIFTIQIVSHNLWSGNRKTFRNTVLVVVVVVVGSLMLSLIKVVFLCDKITISCWTRLLNVLYSSHRIFLESKWKKKPFYCWDNKIRWIQNNNWISVGQFVSNNWEFHVRRLEYLTHN